MNSLDDHLVQRQQQAAEAASLTWWERRRPYYNLFLIGMIGLMVWQLLPRVNYYGWQLVLFWSILYVLAANVFYCLGYLLPLLLKYYLGRDFGLATLADINFNLGVIISLLLTSGIYLWWLL